MYYISINVGDNRQILIDKEFEYLTKWQIGVYTDTNGNHHAIGVDPKTRKTIQLDKHIMNLHNKRQKIIHHIDGNTLNNLKDNLMIIDKV